MPMIYVVETPKPAPPRQPTLAETHPFPWRVGKSHESMCEVVADNGWIVTRFIGGEISMAQPPGHMAEMFVAMMNAAHQS